MIRRFGAYKTTNMEMRGQRITHLIFPSYLLLTEVSGDHLEEVVTNNELVPFSYSFSFYFYLQISQLLQVFALY